MKSYVSQYCKKILFAVLSLILISACTAQYVLWQRYGVWNWWSAKPHYLKVHGRDYKQGAEEKPAPYYCVISTMFPFNYPIAAASDSGPDGKRCTGKKAGTYIYLRWEDGSWTAYGIQGAA